MGIGMGIGMVISAVFIVRSYGLLYIALMYIRHKKAFWNERWRNE